MTEWRKQQKRIGQLPQYGTVKVGNKWFLTDWETGAQLGGAVHNSKLECIAYAYERARAEVLSQF